MAGQTPSQRQETSCTLDSSRSSLVVEYSIILCTIRRVVRVHGSSFD